MSQSNSSTVSLLLIAACLITFTLSVEVRVLTGMVMRGQANLPDHNDQKLVINSNNRYIYPSQQVPEYNIYALPTLATRQSFIQVVSNNYVYPLLKITMRSDAAPFYELVHPYTRKIIPEAVKEPIMLKPVDRMQYLIEQQGFSLTSFLFSGTGLFVVGGLFLYMCYKQIMPKLQQAQSAPES